MSWLKNLIENNSPSTGLVTAHAALILGLVAVLGLGLGTRRAFGVRLGVAGVLFVGLVFGHFGLGIDDTILIFARDFGLILFVYTIGIQIGPGFAASMRRQGVPLNIMAAAIVLLGAGLTVLIGRLLLPHRDWPAMVGVFSGATTNLPSMAAAQQAITILNPAEAHLPGVGFSVAYPFGVLGIILTSLIVRALFRINPKAEAKALAGEAGQARKLEAVTVQVTKDEFDGVRLEALLSQSERPVVVSRVLRPDGAHVATADAVIEQGDVLVAVGPASDVEYFTQLIGEEAHIDVRSSSTDITTRSLLVTRKEIIGKSVPELNLPERCNVQGTRVARGDVEMAATDSVTLMFGDRVTAVGEESALKKAAHVLGDSVVVRDNPMMLPMFLGIALGVMLGCMPIPVPGFPVPLRLGLAGGPLVVALILGRIGKIGPLVWYMPRGANLSVRKLGIILFMAGVGIKAGALFVETLVHGDGLLWMGYGAVITIVPLLSVALFARGILKLNFLPLCGLIAGSMTSPPEIAFDNSRTHSEAPAVAYASVYPLVMLLRILAAQVMILSFH
ncbi:MAG: putative transporter [Capsulimonadaceae bacterium]